MNAVAVTNGFHQPPKSAAEEAHASGVKLLNDSIRQLAALHRQTVALTESVVDPFPSLTPTTNFNNSVNDIFQPAGLQGLAYMDDRKRGDLLPVYMNEWQLRDIRLRSRRLCYFNEFALCAVENRVNYVVGDGFTYLAVPNNPDNPNARKAAKLAQKVIDLFVEVNDLPEVEADTMRRLDSDGDAIIRLFAGADGLIHLRFVQAEHLRSLTGGDSDPRLSYGVITAEGDVETPEKYCIVNNPEQSWNPEIVSWEEIVHIKLNVPRTAKRGCPTFFPVFANLQRCEELLQSMTHMAKVRARLAIIRKLTGVTSSQAQALLDSLAAVRATSQTGDRTLNIEDFPPGGIHSIPGNVEVESPHPNIGASDFVEVLQAELRAVASRLQMPEWMFTALADAKYSNAFVVEAPTLRAFKRLQRKLTNAFGNHRYKQRSSLVWRQLRHAASCGLIPPAALSLIRVECKGPPLEARDKTAEATRSTSLVENRLSSRRTQMQELGYDADEEVKQIASETIGERRPVLDMKEIAAIQAQFYGGSLPKPAAVALLRATLGYDEETAVKLFPGEPTPQQPAGMVPGVGGPGNDGTGGVLTDTGVVGSDPTSSVVAGGNSGEGAPNPLAAIFAGAGQAVGGAEAGLTEQVAPALEIDLLEAGFTGTLRDRLGREYHFEDGKRVAKGTDRTSTAAGAGFASLASGPESKTAVVGHRTAAAQRSILSGLKAGRFTPNEAFDRVQKNYVNAHTALNRAIRLRHGALRADMVSRYGADSLETPEWQAVEQMLDRYREKSLDYLDELHDLTQRNIVSFRDTGDFKPDMKDGYRYTGEAITELAGDYYKQLVPLVAKYKAAVSPQTIQEQYTGSSNKVEIALLEAGFTGRVVDKLGRTYYFVDGKRVKGSQATQVHGGDHKADVEKAKSAKQRALDLHKLAVETPHLLTPEHLAELPSLLTTVPVSELKKMAAAFGGAAGGKLKEEHVAAVAKMFPIPAAVAGLMQQTDHGKAYLARLTDLDGSTVESVERMPEVKLPDTEDTPSIQRQRRANYRDDSDSIGRHRAAAVRQGETDTATVSDAAAATPEGRQSRADYLKARIKYLEHQQQWEEEGSPKEVKIQKQLDKAKKELAGVSEQPAPEPPPEPPPEPQTPAVSGVPPTSEVTKVPTSKAKRKELASAVRNRMGEIKRKVAEKAGHTGQLNDTPQTDAQKAAEAKVFATLEPLASGRERDGVMDLGPISDQRYAGYYKAAVAALDEYAKTLDETGTAGDNDKMSSQAKTDDNAAPVADALDVTADNVAAVWAHHRDEIANADPSLSPAMAGSIAAARIMNDVGRRSNEYIDVIDAKVRRGESITDEEDAKYLEAQDKRKELFDPLVKLSGYRPGAGTEDHPHANRPLNAEPLPNVAAQRREVQQQNQQTAAEVDARKRDVSGRKIPEPKDEFQVEKRTGEASWDKPATTYHVAGKEFHTRKEAESHANVLRARKAADVAKAEADAKVQQAQAEKEATIQKKTEAVKAFQEDAAKALKAAGFKDEAKRIGKSMFGFGSDKPEVWDIVRQIHAQHPVMTELGFKIREPEGQAAEPSPVAVPTAAALSLDNPPAVMAAVADAAKQTTSWNGLPYDPTAPAHVSHKVFVSELYDKLKSRMPGVSLDQFKQHLATHAGAALTRNDLPQVADRAGKLDEVAKSEISLGRATFHTVDLTRLPGAAAPTPVAAPTAAYSKATGVGRLASDVTSRGKEPAKPEPKIDDLTSYRLAASAGLVSFHRLSGEEREKLKGEMRSAKSKEEIDGIQAKAREMHTQRVNRGA